jgi:hypothetical protein
MAMKKGIHMKIRLGILLGIFLLAGTPGVLFSQEEGSGAAQANNPLANMTALNFHNYYMTRLTDAPAGAYLNNTWVRFARPFADGRLLLRVSLPVNTVATPDPVGNSITAVNGLSDVNAFLSYNFISKPTATVGIGPLLAFPTATDQALGSGKWQGGLAFVAFIARSPVFQFGGLITWQASFAGDPDRASTNLAALQPFYFWQLGKGTYLRGAPIWVFDIHNEAYNMPLALGIGKVVPMGRTVFNLFIEPQYTMLHKGTQPQFQLFTGINLQFLSK